MEKNIKDLGNFGEATAVAYLKRKGYEILKQNYFSQYGELDIIALDSNEVVFVEVKTRKSSFSNAQSSISQKKQNKMKLTASDFLSKNIVFQENFTRFDAILIKIDDNMNYKIIHLPDAFR